MGAVSVGARVALKVLQISLLLASRKKRKRRKRALEWWMRRRGELGEDEQLTRAGYLEQRLILGPAGLDSIARQRRRERMQG